MPRARRERMILASQTPTRTTPVVKKVKEIRMEAVEADKRSQRQAIERRMETREAASKAIKLLSGVSLPQTQQKLQVRFADSMAQKRFKIFHQQVPTGIFSGSGDNAL
ncbi:hypothetical protein HK101_000748 [Irineochytrium annulatum]|nr:hypothetical protein HK101_000748 [Irineochytrium annulatum]